MSNNLYKKAINGIAWTTFQSIGVQISSLVIFLVLARLLAPEDFGLVAMANVSIAFFGLLTADSLSAAIIQREHLDKEHYDSVFWLNTFLGLLVGICVYLSSEYIAHFYKQPELERIIDVLIICLICRSFSSVQISILRRELNFRSLAIRTLVGQPIGGIVGITLAFKGFGVWSLVIREVIVSLIQLILVWISSDWRPGLRLSFRHLRELLSFGISMMGAGWVSFLNKRLDNFLIGYALGAIALGYYTVAKRLITILTEFLSSSINKVAWPIFARMKTDHEKLKHAFYQSTQLKNLVVFPVFLGVSAVAPELVLSVFGDKWQPSILLMQGLAILGLLKSILSYQENLMVALGQAGWRLALQFTMAIANVIAFIIAVEWGILAIIISYIAVAVTLSPLWTFGVYRCANIEITTYLSQYVASFVGSVAMVTAIYALRHYLGDLVSHHVVLIVSIILGVLVYVFSIRCLYPIPYKFVLTTLSSIMPRRKKSSTLN